MIVRLTLPLAGLLAAALAVSVAQGVPDRLPGVSLGWAVLLHIERAAAVFAITVAVLSVLGQASRGRLPTQLSTAGLAYEAEGANVAASTAERLQGQIADLSADVDRLTSIALGDQETRR